MSSSRDSLDAKACKKCGVIKPMSDFHYHSDRRDHRNANCKTCQTARVRELYEANKERKLALAKKWDSEHKDEINAAARKRYNPFKHKARTAIYNSLVRGDIERKPCHFCLEPKVDFHHTHGYEKEHWLHGLWLCRKCHHKVHKELRWQTQ